jgi:hypothetical protein
MINLSFLCLLWFASWLFVKLSYEISMVRRQYINPPLNNKKTKSFKNLFLIWFSYGTYKLIFGRWSTRWINNLFLRNVNIGFFQHYSYWVNGDTYIKDIGVPCVSFHSKASSWVIALFTLSMVSQRNCHQKNLIDIDQYFYQERSHFVSFNIYKSDVFIFFFRVFFLIIKDKKNTMFYIGKHLQIILQFA